MLTLDLVQTLMNEIFGFVQNISYTLSAYPAAISVLPAASLGYMG